jgi:protein SSD1
MQQSMGMTPQLLDLQNNLLAQMQNQFSSPPPPQVASPPIGNQPPRFQHQQTSSMGMIASPPLPPQDLVSEQLAIQAQLEQLRLQQEALLSRFGSMGGAMPPVAAPATAGHRRVQSQQVQGFGGPMGSFGGFPQPSMQSMQGGGLPRGHGRRHSVNVVGRDQPAGANQATIIGAPNASMSPTDAHVGPSPAIGFGAFQFPGPGGIENQHVGTDLDFGASPPMGTGGVSGAGGFVAGHSRRDSRGSLGGSISGWNRASAHRASLWISA